MLVSVRVLRDMLTEADKTLRAAIEADSVPGERIAAAFRDGTEWVPVGAVTAKKRDEGGKPKATVTDPAALLAWVAAHCPSEVQTIPASEQVRASFVKVLLPLVESGGWPDPATGELLAPDGITTAPSAPSGGGLMLTLVDDAAELVRTAWEAGLLTVTDLLALPAGQEQAA